MCVSGVWVDECEEVSSEQPPLTVILSLHYKDTTIYYMDTYGDSSTTEPWEVIGLRGIGRNISLFTLLATDSNGEMESDRDCVSVPSRDDVEPELRREPSSSATMDRGGACSAESSRAVAVIE